MSIIWHYNLIEIKQIPNPCVSATIFLVGSLANVDSTNSPLLFLFDHPFSSGFRNNQKCLTCITAHHICCKNDRPSISNNEINYHDRDSAGLAETQATSVVWAVSAKLGTSTGKQILDDVFFFYPTRTSESFIQYEAYFAVTYWTNRLGIQPMSHFGQRMRKSTSSLLQ